MVRVVAWGMQNGVSPGWKYATVALVGLVAAQAIWWNYKAPEVLRLGGY